LDAAVDGYILSRQQLYNELDQAKHHEQYSAMGSCHQTFDWTGDDTMMNKAADLLAHGIGWTGIILSESQCQLGPQQTMLFNADILDTGRQPIARLYVMSENATAVLQNPHYRNPWAFQHMYSSAK
jgi:hypothetical protein